MSNPENTQLEQVDILDAIVEPDYETLPIQVGQYWAAGNNLVAFILDSNDQVVIFQNRMNVGTAGGQETAVFDYESGQEMFSINRLRAHLKEFRAVPVKPPEVMVEAALNTYRRMVANNQIFNPVQLPRGDEGIEEFLETERYEVLRNIIPPPKKSRKRRGFHWLKTGSAGTIFQLKMWDPAKDNWVFPDGNVDPTARIGFVKGYHSEAMVLLDESETETFEQMAARLIALLRSHNFFFDEQHIREELKKRDPAQGRTEEVQLARHLEVTFDDATGQHEPIATESKFEPYNFSLRLKLLEPQGNSYTLTILFERDSRVKYEMTFSNVANAEFIPPQPATFVGFP